MAKTFTSLQWNIGAGKIRTPSSDPLASASYILDGLDYVIECIRFENPDIITLQEVHADSRQNQAEMIAAELGYAYCVSDFYSDSHIERGQRLGQGILSRFPLSAHRSETFTNPHLEVIDREGRVVTTHDKGLTGCTLHIAGTAVAVITLHLPPFDPFKIDLHSEPAKRIFADVESKLLLPGGPLLIQGDLNLGHSNPPAVKLMPKLTNAGITELDLQTPTIPCGEWPDRILHRGLKVKEAHVLAGVLTDHYPIVTTFEV